MPWINPQLRLPRVTFDQAFARLIKTEGGLSMDPDDPGNWTGGRKGVGELKGTKYGIAANTYGDIDIANLTLDQAKAIYYRDWWLKAGGDDLDGAIMFQLWQFAVNAGMSTAKRCLQRAVRVADDGKIGEITIEKVNSMDVNDVLFRLLAQEIRHYTSLRDGFIKYGRGWMNRIAEVLEYAAEDNPEE